MFFCELNYSDKQEAKRIFSTFTNFGLACSMISVLLGIIPLYSFSLANGGPGILCHALLLQTSYFCAHFFFKIGSGDDLELAGHRYLYYGRRVFSGRNLFSVSNNGRTVSICQYDTK